LACGEPGAAITLVAERLPTSQRARGAAIIVMAQRVGPTGRVVGIDVDAKLGREMLSILRSKGYEQCSFIEGNVESLEQIVSDRLIWSFRGSC
jgi:hypothetical protein